jgi:hypothetical protein
MAMLFQESDKKLDMKGIFSFSLDTDLNEISSKFGVKIIARIRRHKDNANAVLNMAYFDGNTKELEEKLKKFNPKKGNYGYVASLDITRSRFLDSFSNFVTIPSVIVDAVIIEEGLTRVYFRFHNSVSKHLSSSFASDWSQYDMFSIDLLGPNDGYRESFSEISKKVPLYSVEIKSRVPGNDMDITGDIAMSTFGSTWEREVKYLIGGNIQAIYYDSRSLLKKDSRDVVEISTTDGIYQATFVNPLIEYYMREAENRQIATLALPQRLVGNQFSFDVVVPKMLLTEFYSLIFESFKKFPDWKMELGQIVPL